MANDQPGVGRNEPQAQHRHTNDEIIEYLRTQIAEKRAVLVVGPRVPYLVTNGMETALPSGLLKSGIEHCKTSNTASAQQRQLMGSWLSTGRADQLRKLAEDLEHRLGAPSGDHFIKWIDGTVGSLSKCISDPSIINTLYNTGAPIITTNLDTIIEEVTGAATAHLQDIRSITNFCQEQGRFIFHAFGVHKTHVSIHISRMYGKIARERQEASALADINEFISNKNLILIGFTNSDLTPIVVLFEQILMNDLRERTFYWVVSEQQVLKPPPALTKLIPVRFEPDPYDLVTLLRQLRPSSETEQDNPFPESEPGRVPYHPDDPATVDLLGRAHVALVIWGLLKSIRRGGKIRRWRRTDRDTPQTRTDGAFLIHLHGPWGSGKSSLLNFIRQRNPAPSRDRDRPRTPWVIVEFNAWQQQHLGAAWWELIDQVYRQGQLQLRSGSSKTRHRWRWMKLLLKERCWRFWSGWGPTIWLFGAIAFGGWAAWYWFSSGAQAGTTPATTFTSDAIRIVPAISVAGVLLKLVIDRVWGSFGTTQAAETFLKASHDSMRRIGDHYRRLVKQLGFPLLVLIDDLDRCDAAYVVELLHAITNTYRQAPVVYVIAADREWICASYQQTYEGFAKDVREPGRPLGHLFLEKLFQLSVAVPTMSSGNQDDYLRRLMESASVAMPAADPQFKAELDNEFSGRSESEIARAAEARAAKEQELSRILAIAEAVADAAASDSAIAETREFLSAYRRLLEPNPRAMKRLLNTYRFQRDFREFQRYALLRSPGPSGVRSDRVAPELLVLWTIVELRWPLLAETLARRPGLARYIGNKHAPKTARIPESLQELFASDMVARVFDANGLRRDHPKLDEANIRKLVGAEHRPVDATATVSVA